MFKKLLLTLSILMLLPTTCRADYIFIWLRNDTGLTADDDKGVAKRGEVISVTPDNAPPSVIEKANFLVIQTDPLTQLERDELTEEWGDPIGDRANYHGKRRLFNVDALEAQFGITNGLVPTKRNINSFKKLLRLKGPGDLALYEDLRKSRYVKRQLQRFIDWIDPTRKASAETITTICPSSCDYTTGDNWETTEGGGGTLSEIKTGNIKDDDGSFGCGSINIDGQTTSSSAYMRLYSSPTERHSGSETTGASGTGSLITVDGGGYCINIADEYTRIEYLQINGNGATHNSVIGTSTSTAFTIDGIIIRDVAVNRAGIRNYNGVGYIINTLMYDVTTDSCIESEQASSNITVYNTTVINCGKYGYERNNAGSVLNVYNSVSCGATTADFHSAITAADQIVSCDTSANAFGGTSTVDYYVSQTASNLFEDPTGHDYTPKTGSVLIDFGNDYTTSPAGVNTDLAGRDRDSEGDTWDSGAIELVIGGSPPAFLPKVIFF